MGSSGFKDFLSKTISTRRERDMSNANCNLMR
jgi:hypothetical protein